MNVILFLAVCIVFVSTAHGDTCYYTTACYKAELYLTMCGWWSSCFAYRNFLSACQQSSTCTYNLSSCGNCSCSNRTQSCTYKCKSTLCSLPDRFKIQSCNATDCPPVNGGWGPWANWTSECTCSVTCGGGTQLRSRSRSCNSPEPQYGGRYCSGNSIEYTTFSCSPATCPAVINGGWSNWGGWTPYGTCSVTCDKGLQAQIRKRTCTNPIPQDGGRPCNGTSTDSQTTECQVRNCIIDGSWNAWSSWTLNASCSTTCGTGIMTEIRNRTCNNPVPQNGGQRCIGLSEEYQKINCYTRTCPIDGNWGAWNNWISNGTCSVTCGTGIKTKIRNRGCNNPFPQYDGRHCIGTSTESQSIQCNTQACPIDGSWGDWNIWTVFGKCSVTCSGGLQIQTRNRTCTKPSPRDGGRQCIGISTESQVTQCLTTTPCSIDGSWGLWNGWTSDGTCSVTCGTGITTETRNRTCNNPIPQADGRQCNGTSTECQQFVCNRTVCPIDGNWSVWSKWISGPCNDQCDRCTQLQNRNRSCTNPIPEYGGKQCIGTSNESQIIQCNSIACPPIDGVWNPWSPWTYHSECSDTCGGGTKTKTRTRICTGARYGGRECNGSAAEHQQEKCNTLPCPPVDGGWNLWTSWTSKGSWNVTCYGGMQIQSRTRSCTNPTPQNCGSPCKGNSQESRTIECNRLTCPPECKSEENFLNCSIPSIASTVKASRVGGSGCNSVNCTCEAIVHGYIMHPTDCKKFIQCTWNTPFVYSCPNGTYWDQSRQTCKRGLC